MNMKMKFFGGRGKSGKMEAIIGRVLGLWELGCRIANKIKSDKNCSVEEKVEESEKRKHDNMTETTSSDNSRLTTDDKTGEEEDKYCGGWI